MNNQDNEFSSSDDERFYEAGKIFLRNKLQKELDEEIQVSCSKKYVLIFFN